MADSFTGQLWHECIRTGRRMAIEIFPATCRVHKSACRPMSLMVCSVDKGEDFGDHDVDRRRDFLVKVQLGQDLNQGRVFFDRNTVLFGQLQDFFGKVP
jgi:hypothetical protein